LKASLGGLNIGTAKLFIFPAVVPDGARIIRKVFPTMNRILSALVMMGALGVVASAPPSAIAAAPIPDIGGAVPSLAPMLARVTPGVVNIAVRGKVREQNPLLQDPFFRRFFSLPENQRPQERETQATGSGVIVDAARGYVLTNGHVVENATRIEVTTKDNHRFTAKLIGRDPDTDIAVLQIPTNNLTAVPMGDSDRLQVGDFVLAIGNPFGLGQTVT
jgi:S1-C subfamily serine protease